MIHLALLLAAAQTSPAQSPTYTPVVAAEASPDGAWDGGMTVPAGLTIPFTLDLTGNGGRFAAPDQQVRDVPVTVATDARHVVVTLPGGGATFDATLSADGAVLSGTWTRGTQSFPARFTRRGKAGVAAQQSRPQTPLAPFPYEAREVTLATTDRITLGGTLTRPSGPAIVPAILLIGGNGPQTRDETYAGHRPMLLVADRLTRAGFAVLRYDKRGVGTSTGRYETASGADLVGDAKAALTWLRVQPGVDAHRTCVLGLSEGAMIAPMVAVTEQPACVILLSPPGVPSAVLLGEQARLAALDDGKSADVARRDGAVTRAVVNAMARGEPKARRMKLAVSAGATDEQSGAIVRDLDTPEVRIFLVEDPAIALRRLTMPVLVVVGANDQQVAPALNLPPVRAALARNVAAQILVMPGLNHILQPASTGAVRDYATTDITMDERALDAIVRFVGETTGSVRPVHSKASRPSRR